jgi:hypothetical protein
LELAQSISFEFLRAQLGSSVYRGAAAFAMTFAVGAPAWR